MTRARRSRTRKSSPRIILELPYASPYEIKRGQQYIQEIFATCRRVELELREQHQNPLADTLRYLNLAEPRLGKSALEAAIRPYFYFGYKHKEIPNQKAFQDTVRERLSDADAVTIFDKMIRVYFQALDYRVDGRNGKKTFGIALGPGSTKPVTRVPFHAIVYWGRTGTSDIHIAQYIIWNGCRFLISYGKLSSTITTAFKRSLRDYTILEVNEFLNLVESRFITRLADPAGRHRLDLYLQKHSPTARDLLETVAQEALPATYEPSVQNLVEFAADHHTESEFHALNQTLIRAHATLNQKYSFFPSLSRALPFSTIQQTLYADPIQAAEHLKTIESHPVQYLLLDEQTLHDANLSPEDPIHGTHALPTYHPAADTIHQARQTYIAEQRLVEILRATWKTSCFTNISTIYAALNLADPRFLNSYLGQLDLEKRYQTTLFRFVENYVLENLPHVDYYEARLLTFAELLNPPPYHDLIDFNQLAKNTRDYFNIATMHLLQFWRSIYSPPTISPRSSTRDTINALQEINDLFET